MSKSKNKPSSNGRKKRKPTYKELLAELDSHLKNRKFTSPKRVKRKVQGPRSTAKFMGISPNCKKMTPEEQKALLDEVNDCFFITFSPGIGQAPKPRDDV